MFPINQQQNAWGEALAPIADPDMICASCISKNFERDSGSFMAALVGVSTTVETEERNKNDGDIFTSLKQPLFSRSAFRRNDV